MTEQQAQEIVRKIRKQNPIYIIPQATRKPTPSDYEWEFVLPESEAVALLTDEPSKTAEELGRKMAEEAYEGCEEYFTALIQSALTAHAKAAVEEAADRFCEQCPIRTEAIGGGLICDRDGRGRVCPWRAAILGLEVGELENEQTCQYCGGTGVTSDSIGLTKPCPRCSGKQSAHKGNEGRG